MQRSSEQTQQRHSRRQEKDIKTNAIIMKMHDNRNQNMDSSFYQDESAQYTSQSQNTRKRPETLDLNKQPAKRPRFNQSLTTSGVLNSPDVQKLSLATPDIEKFIISHSVQTPTPSLVFPQTVRVSQLSNSTRDNRFDLYLVIYVCKFCLLSFA